MLVRFAKNWFYNLKKKLTNFLSHSASKDSQSRSTLIASFNEEVALLKPALLIYLLNFSKLFQFFNIG